jgi:hypothetical protein
VRLPFFCNGLVVSEDRHRVLRVRKFELSQGTRSNDGDNIQALNGRALQNERPKG